MLKLFQKKYDKTRTKEIVSKSHKIKRFAQSYYLGEWNKWEYFVSGNKIYIVFFDKNKTKFKFIATLVNNSIVDFKGKGKYQKDDIKNAENNLMEWLNSTVEINGKPKCRMYEAIDYIQKFDKNNKRKLVYCKQLKDKNDNFSMRANLTICPLKREEYNLIIKHNDFQLGYFYVNQKFPWNVFEVIKNLIKQTKGKMALKLP